MNKLKTKFCARSNEMYKDIMGRDPADDPELVSKIQWWVKNKNKAWKILLKQNNLQYVALYGHAQDLHVDVRDFPQP